MNVHEYGLIEDRKKNHRFMSYITFYTLKTKAEWNQTMFVQSNRNSADKDEVELPQ